MTESNLSTLERDPAESWKSSPSCDPSQDVDLQVEKIDRRQRKIQARIQLPYTPEQIWSILTHYEALSDFIPNLASSLRCEHPEGGIRIEQVGTQNALMVKFSARVVLDMEERFPQRLSFKMVEGDFKDFQGAWTLSSQVNSTQPMTELTYCVQIWPKRSMPIIAVEKRLSKDLPMNLLAIRQRLDTLYGNPALS